MIRRILTLLAIASFPLIARSSVPPLLNYQSVLRDAAGDLAPNGNYSVTFRIWDAETGGTALWQEGRLVTVQDGLFTVLLGSIVPIPDTLFSRPDRWIGLQAGLDLEMSPRQRLISLPYAWHSLESERSDTAAVAQFVDTTGYSAYADLLSEGKLGTGADQIAAGDHAHPPAVGSSTMMRYEDNRLIDTVLSAGGSVVLKSITITPGEVGSFLRISFSSYSNEQSAAPYFGLVVEGQQIFTLPIIGDRSVCWWSQRCYEEQDGPQWRGIAVYYPTFNGSTVGPAYARIDSSDGVNVAVQITNASPGTRIRCGNFLVEYDKD